MEKKTFKYTLATVGVLLTLIAFLLFAAPFASAGVGASVSGFDALGDAFQQKGGVASALAFTCLLLVTTGFIAVRAFMKKGEDTLSKTNTVIFASALGAVAFVTFLLQCLTLVIAELNDVPGLKIGGGAVASGLMVLFGAGASAASLFVKANGADGMDLSCINNCFIGMKKYSKESAMYLLYATGFCCLFCYVGAFGGGFLSVIGVLLLMIVEIALWLVIPLLLSLGKQNAAKRAMCPIFAFWILNSIFSSLRDCTGIGNWSGDVEIAKGVFELLLACALIVIAAFAVFSIAKEDQKPKKTAFCIFAGCMIFYLVIFALTVAEYADDGAGWSSYFGAIYTYLTLPFGMFFLVQHFEFTLDDMIIFDVPETAEPETASEEETEAPAEESAAEAVAEEAAEESPVEESEEIFIEEIAPAEEEASLVEEAAPATDVEESPAEDAEEAPATAEEEK